MIPNPESEAESEGEDTGEVESSDPDTPTPQPRGRQMFVLDRNAAEHLGCTGFVTDQFGKTVPVVKKENEVDDGQTLPDNDPPQTDSNRSSSREGYRTKMRTTGTRDRSGSNGSAYPRARVEQALNAQNENARVERQRHSVRGPDGRFVRKSTSEGDM